MSFEEAYELATQGGCLQLPKTRARRLYFAARSSLLLEGEYWECGVFRGGSARLIADSGMRTIGSHALRLFDTFSGFANVGPLDRAWAKNGRMFHSERAEQEVSEFVDAPFVTTRRGPIPECFSGLEDSRIAFANVDVDLYRPTLDALDFILPRLVPGGAIIVDDYGDCDWPGVKIAVQESMELNGFSDGSLEVEETQARIVL